MEKFIQDTSHESASEKTKDTILFCRPDELSGHLTEFTEQSSVEEFFRRVCDDADMLAQVSYWEKWLTRDQISMLERIRLEQRRDVRKNELPLGIENRFDEKERDVIFSNTSAVQLTVGCSFGCPHCGFDAVKGVKEEIPYEQIKNMFQRYGNKIGKSKPMLYWASEPSDYHSVDIEGNEKSYPDIHKLAVDEARYTPEITTQNHSESWLNEIRAIKRRTDLSSKTSLRVSAHGLSDEEISRLNGSEEKEVFKIIGTGAKPEERKKLIGMGITQKKQEDLDPDKPKSGIACRDGILITPRGLYGMVVVPISKEFPQGQIIMPLHEISNLPIKSGDSMKEILTRAIVETNYSHEGIGFDADHKYQIFNESKIRRYVNVLTNTDTYLAFFDGMTGNIIESACLIKEPKIYLQNNKERMMHLAETDLENMDSLIKEISNLIFSLLHRMRGEFVLFNIKAYDVSTPEVILDILFNNGKEFDIKKIANAIERTISRTRTILKYNSFEDEADIKIFGDFEKDIDQILEILLKIKTATEV